MPKAKDKDELDRLRAIVVPVREDLARVSRVQKAIARLRNRKAKENKPRGEKDGAE